MFLHICKISMDNLNVFLLWSIWKYLVIFVVFRIVNKWFYSNSVVILTHRVHRVTIYHNHDSSSQGVKRHRESDRVLYSIEIPCEITYHDYHYILKYTFPSFHVLCEQSDFTSLKSNNFKCKFCNSKVLFSISYCKDFTILFIFHFKYTLPSFHVWSDESDFTYSNFKLKIQQFQSF